MCFPLRKSIQDCDFSRNWKPIFTFNEFPQDSGSEFLFKGDRDRLGDRGIYGQHRVLGICSKKKMDVGNEGVKVI